MPEPLSPSTSAISFAYLRILPNSRFQIWGTQKYKDVMEFVKKPLLCDKDVMHTNDITTYGLLTQESLREYSNIVNSKKVDFKG